MSAVTAMDECPSCSEIYFRFSPFAINRLETGVKSLKEFASGFEGWRWNIGGRVLFERLVKYHPVLVKFFRAAATDLVGGINNEISSYGILSTGRESS
jgi:hypothetical protein